MSEHKLTLQDILAAKDLRQMRQQSIREKYGTAIASITINMPGPVKDRPVLRQLLDYAVNELKRGLKVLAEDRIYPVTGPETIVVIEDTAERIKKVAVRIEESKVFGRLLDIDVFTASGELLSRRQQGQERPCLICGESAVACMRGRRHSSAELVTAVDKLLNAFKAYQARFVSPIAEKIGGIAVEAMLYEVAATPAPGLVDRVNSGAHKDMDFYSFMASSAALSLTMARTAQAGLLHEDMPLSSLLPVLRLIGQEGEKYMMAATGGVNTQKGLLFSLGIMTAAAGWLQGRGQSCSAAAVLDKTAEIVSGIVERELGSIANKDESRLTAGERLYRDYGITGIRGELAAGLPAVRNRALPELRNAISSGSSKNDALIQTLFVLMTCVEDTTVMNRHDPATMRYWVKEKAQAVLDDGGMATPRGREKAAALDAEFIARNISPGGTADLLAVTWFLYRLEMNHQE